MDLWFLKDWCVFIGSHCLCRLACNVYKSGHFTHKIESPWPLHFKHSHWWTRRSRSKFKLHTSLRDQHGKCLQDGCKVYVASNGLCIMVTWTIFKYQLLEVGLRQNRETMALWTLTIIDLFYFIHVWGPTWSKIHWNSIWLRYCHICLHTTLEDPWPHYMILKVSWDGLWKFSFGHSQSQGHGSWLMCEVAPSLCTKDNLWLEW
jgi:hypothetical protein